ncbi:rhomboid family intramembrane serine protease [Effusibacillus pohliae]|uniref:rhomboid family intramembrane serine protease n=1 Tax=Effusibacillus pohliae TaxID=232270 RepID=UPI0003648589|nr:rhomboid family intramembrane serine protease [Effusibacillus pohliae]
MESFELVLARELIQKEGYAWFPPGVLFPETSLFKSDGRRGVLLRLVRGFPEPVQALLDSSFARARDILSEHPLSGITVVQLITFPTAPDERLQQTLKTLERHEMAPDIAVYTAWLDLESKRFASNLPWISKGILPESTVLAAADRTDQPLPPQELQQQILETLERRDTEWRNVFVETSSKAVYSLLAIMIGLFAWMWAAGAGDPSAVLIRFGAKVNERILAGEYWRLVTPMFLHLNVLHLLVNAFALYSLRNAEWIFGSNRFLLIFLLAGISGNVASFAASPYPAVGASGAIFGILGALLYFGTQRREFFRRTMGSAIWTTLAINLLLGLMIPNISNSGHIGGLAGGFLAAAAVGLPQQPFRAHRLLAASALFGLLGFGILAGFHL